MNEKEQLFIEIDDKIDFKSIIYQIIDKEAVFKLEEPSKLQKRNNIYMLIRKYIIDKMTIDELLDLYTIVSKTSYQLLINNIINNITPDISNLIKFWMDTNITKLHQ